MAGRARGKKNSAVEGRRPMVAGNWKMHLTHIEAIGHTQRLAFSLTDDDNEAVEVVLLPPFTSIRSVQTLVDGDRLGFAYGAQDLAVDSSGAHTGDVSGPMLAALGCTHVVVGHSERRADHGEDDALVRAKLGAALQHGLCPIVCVGERLEVRKAGEHVPFVLAQLDAALHKLPADQAAGLVIAYEPVWAIGTGENATPDDAQEMAAALRARLAETYTPDLAAGVRLLYGGSVKATNAADLFAAPDVDGGLVGGASLDSEEFANIARFPSLEPA